MRRQRTATRRRCYSADLLKAIGKFLPHCGLHLFVDDARVRWVPRMLVTCVVMLGWMSGSNLAECFAASREVVVAIYLSRRRPGETLAGFLSALQKHSAELLAVVVQHLRQMTFLLAGRQWRLGPWVVMGADGSRVECPMTRSNERHLGCAGKDKTTPQLFVTTLFHVVTGLPWAWIRGRGDASERGQLRRMLKTLPLLTLLLMDAGFPGYVLLRALMALEHHKMRSDTPERAKVELDWYMVGLWMLGLMTLEAMGPRRRVQRRWSAAGALSCVRKAMRNARRPRRGGGLPRQLRDAVQDSYERRRPKKARHYPRKKTERPAGRPQIRTATRSENAAAQAFGQPRAPN